MRVLSAGPRERLRSSISLLGCPIVRFSGFGVEGFGVKGLGFRV